MKNLITLILLLSTLNLTAQTTTDNYRNWTREVGSGEHIALVIGNSQYQHRGRLLRPAEDAQAISEALSAQGYNVLEAFNLERDEMMQAIADFSKRVKSAKTCVVFYAGHGFQVGSNNYLIPTDANPDYEWQLNGQCVNVNDIFKAIDQPDIPKLIILDACRNNPFTNLAADTRDMTTGMGAVRTLINSKIVFSTAKNTVVKDDNPFAEIFAENIKTGGCIEEILGKVSKSVREERQNQLIWQEGNLEEVFCFGEIPVDAQFTDTDQDGILDDIDQCPNKFGSMEHKGCPPPKPKNITTIKPTPKGNPPALAAPEGMIFVQGGSFNMGCTSEQLDCEKHESPVRLVKVKDFFIAPHEVTNQQYADFLNAAGNQYIKGNSNRWYGIRRSESKIDYQNNTYSPRASYENHPVANISWFGAAAYCEWQTLQTGRTHRLPTEAEWEYAARGGSHAESYLHSGDNRPEEIAWNGLNSEGTNPVMQKKANTLGIYDMSGNVWEWCSDWYDDTYDANTLDNPQGPTKGRYRVLRGGSWNYPVTAHRVSSRNWDSPDNNHRDFVGFRVVIEPNDTKPQTTLPRVGTKPKPASNPSRPDKSINGKYPTPTSGLDDDEAETGDLGGRNMLRRPNFDFVKQDGLIVLYVCADKYGRITKAQAVKSQSTIKDNDILLRIAKAVKSSMRFSPGRGTDCMYYKVRIEGSEY